MDLTDFSPPSRVRGAKLDTLGAVKSELGRIYREARRGDMDAQRATRLASILLNLARLMEAGGSEKSPKTAENDPE